MKAGGYQQSLSREAAGRSFPNAAAFGLRSSGRPGKGFGAFSGLPLQEGGNLFDPLDNYREYSLRKGFMIDKFLLRKDEVLLVLIDIQERLAAAMKKKEAVTANVLHLVELARLLQIPMLVTEQYPRGLGNTLEEIKSALPAYEPFEKTAFDCCREIGFIEKVAASGRQKILLTGMETHVCVLQTGLGLIQAGYSVQVIQDACCSRTKDNFKIGLEWLRDAGAVITGTETVLFQLLEKAGTEPFKVISKRIK
jgi:nicotinamidase-related amidase